MLWMGMAAIAAGVGAAPEAVAPPTTTKEFRRLIAMTPEQFGAKVTTKDDAFESQATFTTEPGWRESPSDTFLRAFVDKKTGVATFQLYAKVEFKREWPQYRTISYYTAEGLQEGELIRIDGDANCGPVRYGGGCSLTEHVAFDLPESLVRQMAALYQPNGVVFWKFKLKGRFTDGDRIDGIPPAEAAGLLLAIDIYRNHLPIAAR